MKTQNSVPPVPINTPDIRALKYDGSESNMAASLSRRGPDVRANLMESNSPTALFRKLAGEIRTRHAPTLRTATDQLMDIELCGPCPLGVLRSSGGAGKGKEVGA